MTTPDEKTLEDTRVAERPVQLFPPIPPAWAALVLFLAGGGGGSLITNLSNNNQAPIVSQGLTTADLEAVGKVVEEKLVVRDLRAEKYVDDAIRKAIDLHLTKYHSEP